MNEETFQKVVRGLNLRLEAAKLRHNKKPLNSAFKKRVDSLARDYHISVSGYDKEVERKNALDIQLARVVLEQSSIEDQRNVYSSLDGFTQTEYLPHIILGYMYESPKKDEPSRDSIVSSMDLSLYIQYLLFSGKIDLEERLLKEIERYYSKINLVLFGSENPTFEDCRRLAKSSLTGLSGLEAFYQALLYIKSEYWYAFGVDLLDVVISLVSPKQVENVHLSDHVIRLLTLTGWLQIVETLANAWSSSELFAGFKSTRNVFSDTKEEISEEDPRALQVYRKTKTPLKGWEKLGNDHLSITTSFVRNAEHSLRQGKYRLAIKWFNSIATIDRSLFRMIDWGELNESLPPDCGVFSFNRAFVEFLFLEFEETFPDAVSDRGEGTFTGVIAEVLDRELQRGRSIRQILLEIRRSLPKSAAIQLTSKLLSRGMISRFSTRLPIDLSAISTDRTTDVSDYERLIGLRVSMTREARDLHLVSPKRAAEILREERRMLAVLKFKREFAKGRIRMPWQIVRFQISNFVNSTVDHFNHDNAEEETAEFTKALIEYLTLDLVESLLFHGASSLDYILGSNLRHGVIITTYMSTFPKSLREVTVGQAENLQWHDQANAELLGKTYHLLNSARENIHALLEEFISFWLTLNDEGELASTLQDTILNYMVDVHANRSVEIPDLKTELFDLTQQVISDFINRGRVYFKRSVAVEIEKIAGEVRSQIIENGCEYSLIGDVLLSQIRELNKEVPTWINAVLDEGEFDDFTAREIVSLECEFLHLRRLKDSRVSIKNYAIVDGKKSILTDLVFRGGAFSIINEIVHNLFSNAVKYSGLGKDVRIAFEFIYDGQDIVITAENNLERDARKPAYDGLKQAQELASCQEPAQRRVDKFSGFAKIQTLAWDFWGRPAEIELDFPRKFDSYYKVKILLKDAVGELVSAATHIDSRRSTREI